MSSFTVFMKTKDQLELPHHYGSSGLWYLIHTFKLVAGQALEALWGQPSSEGLSITSMGGKPASCSCNALIFQIWILNFFLLLSQLTPKESGSIKKPENSCLALSPKTRIIYHFFESVLKKNKLTTIKLSSFSSWKLKKDTQSTLPGRQ